MKALVLSDLHLDFRKFSAVHKGQRIDDGVDVVILAGDIHEGVEGIRWARETFVTKEVIYVAGNHEFYDNNISYLPKYMREVAARMGVHFLERDAVEIQSVRFLGTTLWSNFEMYGLEKMEESMSECSKYMNDFKCINTSEGFDREAAGSIRQRLFTPTDARAEFDLNAAWLESALAAGDPARTVVVTHHAPHSYSVEVRYINDLVTGAYCSDLTRLMGRCKYWIHGHMHASSRYHVNGTEVIANPRGYSRWDGSNENSFFEPNLVIEI